MRINNWFGIKEYEQDYTELDVDGNENHDIPGEFFIEMSHGCGYGYGSNGPSICGDIYGHGQHERSLNLIESPYGISTDASWRG